MCVCVGVCQLDKQELVEHRHHHHPETGWGPQLHHESDFGKWIYGLIITRLDAVHSISFALSSSEHHVVLNHVGNKSPPHSAYRGEGAQQKRTRDAGGSNAGADRGCCQRHIRVVSGILPTVERNSCTPKPVGSSEVLDNNSQGCGFCGSTGQAFLQVIPTMY